MNLYRRNGKISARNEEQSQKPAPAAAPPSKRQAQNPAQGVKINGYQQVVDLLLAADPAFRESLLARIARQDSQLASNLRQTLASC